MSAADRLMRFVEPAIDGCWHWSGGVFQASGYGAFRLHGKAVGAHVASLTLLGGLAPNGRSCLHRCDVKLCVNPAHLYFGTQRENVNDMVERGRQCCGLRRSQSILSSPKLGRRKLTEAQVLAIVKQARAGLSHPIIANRYKISSSNVSKIMNGEAWSSVTGIPCRRHNWNDHDPANRAKPGGKAY